MANNIIRMWGAPGNIPSQVSATGPQNSGQFYSADALGFVAVDPRDVPELLRAGFTVSPQPSSNFRNLIDGGDFTVNPFQRNIAGLASGGVLSAAITNTVTYFADRFFAVGGASSSILMAKVAATDVPSFSQELQVYRSSGNSNLAPIYFGQVMETADSIRCQGQMHTLSFWMRQLANFTGGAVTASIIAGTGADQSAASMIAGTWTGQTTVATLTFTPATGVKARVSLTGAIPANATQIGVLWSFTPAGTAGTGDGFAINGIQLEQGPSATTFEHLDIQVVTEICQRYTWVIAEPANGVLVGSGTTLGANSQNFYMATPVQFRSAPTVTVSAGSFKVAAAAAYAAATSLAAGATHTVNAISLTAANTAAAGVGALLGGGGGSGYIVASSDY